MDMSTGQLRALCRAVAQPVALLLLVSGTAAAQAATISGRVSAAGGTPLPESRIIVVGTTLFGSTGADGRYTIRNVPAGNYDLRVIRVGYAEQKRPVTVAAGATATVDFTLQPVVVQLQEVVTTATGEQRRVELGNAVSTVDASKRTQTAPVTDMASLLVAQSPGVQVLPGNTTGTGARVRIRGINSLSLTNDPIYIIDGVRMTSSNGSQSANIFTGGAIQSRAQDLNPDEIESIEVVKGPSAATLYGTDASNGVIVITTKRGRAGETRWNAIGELGTIKDYNTWPTAYTLFGHAPAGSSRNCATPSLTQVSSGVCVADSLSSFNLFENSNTTPLGTGNRRKAGLQVGGGTQAVRYFTSGEYEDEQGIMQIPAFDRQRLDTLHIAVKDEWKKPNELLRGTFRANVDAQLGSKFDAQISTGFISEKNRLPQSDNNALGLLSNGFGGPGYESKALSTLGFQLHGYRQSTPAESFQDVATQYINRFIGSTSSNYRPTSWLSAHADAGLDYASRIDQQFCARGTCADVGTTRQGFVQDDRAAISTLTVNATSTAQFQLLPWLNSKSSVGTQWVRSGFDRNGAGSTNLPPGASTVNAGATQIGDESYDNSKTFGYFGEEQLGVRDRLFLTAALRSDQNSAFGTKFQRVFYPKFSASYVISDEDWFPKYGWLNQLRLRSAYGASGVQPGSNDALRYFTPTTVNVGLQDQPGLYYTALGNEDLRPERATEFEGGLDTKLFGNRANFEVTYYSKLTKDALIGAVVPPTLGSGNSTRRANLGSVKNAGLELGLNGQIYESRAFAWDANLSYSQNYNKLVSLGTDAQGNPLPPQVGTTTRQQPGYPINGYWQRQYTFSDKNGDGIITLDEITGAGANDSSTFVGYSIPPREASLTNGFDLFNRTLRISTLFDMKRGGYLLNGTERIRCQSRNNCYGAYDKSAPLWQQARAVVVRESGSRSQAGYMEKSDFVRFRELSATYAVPQSLLHRVGRAKSASLTFSARNIHIWTKYSGIDPESNADAGNTGSLASDFQTVPPPTYFVFRLNLGF
jgi:TonB-linked SusC/RagA family outer membrane protein